MNKKGVELSMNVIIISILVILVLVVLSFFFLGGTSNLFSKIQEIGPDNLEIAIGDCQSKCQLIQSRIPNDPGENNPLITGSSYCRTTFNVDTNGDGISDQKHHCWSNRINIKCPGIDSRCSAYDNPEEDL